MHAEKTLRWPHTISAHALDNAIQRTHKDNTKQTWRRYNDHFIWSMPSLSVLFSSYLNTVYVWLYSKNLLLKMYARKGNDAKNPGILSFFPFLLKEPSKMQRMHSKAKNCD